MLMFYHPTTVLVVDDDPLFLDSFTFRYGSTYSCRTTTSPEEAVALVEAGYRTEDRQIVAPASTPSDEASRRALVFNSAQIADRVRDPTRFGVVSVALIDYAMPRLTGLELCRRLRTRTVKLVLLTGKAGHETAVNAFNEGLIDAYLTKQDPELPAKVQQHIERLQFEYFESRSSATQLLTRFDDTSFPDDPEFARFFTRLAQERRWVEYYLMGTPPGYLAATAVGEQSVILIHDDDGMTAQIEAAAAAGAPPELRSALAARTCILACPTPSGFYEPWLRERWRSLLFQAQIVGERRRWHLAVVPASALADVLPPYSMSLDEHRASTARQSI